VSPRFAFDRTDVVTSLRASTLAYGEDEPWIGTAQATANVGVSSEFDRSSPGVHAAGIGAPDPSTVQAAIGTNHNVADAFASRPALAIVDLGGFAPEPDTGTAIFFSSSVSLGFDASLLGVSALAPVTVGFLDPISIGDAFERLHFRVTLGGSTLLDEVFLDVATAVAWFDDHVVGLSAPLAPNSSFDLGFELELTGARSPGFGVDFLVSVPEPGTAMLVAMGLIVLAARRRSA
jgi:hypothetical protein